MFYQRKKISFFRNVCWLNAPLWQLLACNCNGVNGPAHARDTMLQIAIAGVQATLRQSCVRQIQRFDCSIQAFHGLTIHTVCSSRSNGKHTQHLTLFFRLPSHLSRLLFHAATNSPFFPLPDPSPSTSAATHQEKEWQTPLSSFLPPPSNSKQSRAVHVRGPGARKQKGPFHNNIVQTLELFIFQLVVK